MNDGVNYIRIYLKVIKIHFHRQEGPEADGKGFSLAVEINADHHLYEHELWDVTRPVHRFGWAPFCPY